MEWVLKTLPEATLVRDGISEVAAEMFGQPGRIEEVHWAYNHKLYVFWSGDCCLGINDERVLFHSGDFVILPPLTKHQVSIPGPDAAKKFTIHFNWVSDGSTFDRTKGWVFAEDEIDEQLARPAPTYVPAGVIRGHVNLSPSLYGLLKSIKQAWINPHSVEKLMVRPRLLELMIRLLGDTRGQVPSGAGALAEKVKDRLIQLFPVPGALPEAFGDFGYSYEHLCRCFREAHGQSPLQFLQEMRLCQAAAMLRNTHYPVKFIGYELGYDSTSYFIKVFRQRYGISPGQFREQEAEDSS